MKTEWALDFLLGTVYDELQSSAVDLAEGHFSCSDVLMIGGGAVEGQYTRLSLLAGATERGYMGKHRLVARLFEAPYILAKASYIFNIV